MRTPPGESAYASPGTVFLFREMDAHSQTFSTLEPVRPWGRRSHRTKWLSVPSLASLWPSSCSVFAKVAEFSTTCFEYSLNSGVATRGAGKPKRQSDDCGDLPAKRGIRPCQSSP